MNIAPSPATSQSFTSQKHRYGLMKARIGSSHMIRGKDGVMRQVMVRDRERHARESVVWFCLSCRVDFKTEAELVEAHPEPHIMERQQEKHVYAMWSDKPVAEDSQELVGLLSTEA